MSRWITGYHAIESAIEAQGGGRLLVAPGGNKRAVELERRARLRGVRVERVSAADLARQAGGAARGVAYEPGGTRLTLVELSQWIEAVREREHLLVLALDHITDPHNLGAILRSADLFAVDLVVIPARRSVLVNDTVERTSAGAAAHVPIAIVGNLVRALETLQENGLWIYAATLEGEPLPTAQINARCVYVLGAEGAGLSQLARKTSDGAVFVETRGHVDSFNVSVAAALLCYEYRRRVGF